ncbi:MAG TPA: carbon storage regulator CsrA [Syntrophomonadaceae bacterium]|nr:carbon storage regulator CsrA [Syntrophomonadaceae bacterium]
MLVLSRKKGQSIVIGDSIEITVVDVQGDMVRIGINAPREITVHRQEVFQQIKAENQQALQQSQGLEIKLRQLTELSKNIDKKDKA